MAFGFIQCIFSLYRALIELKKQIRLRLLPLSSRLYFRGLCPMFQ